MLRCGWNAGFWLQLCRRKSEATSAHGHVDDTTCPNINGAGVNLLVNVLLGGGVSSRPAKAGRHVSTVLPGHAKAFAIAEIFHLDDAFDR